MNRFFLILDIEFHPEKGTEGTCFHGHANAKENLPSVLSVVSHVETENQSYSLVISLDVVLSLLIFEFLLGKRKFSSSTHNGNYGYFFCLFLGPH